MATLETQYKNFLLDNPDSKFNFEEWKEWFGKQLVESIKNMERTFNSDDLSWIAFSLLEYSRSMDYEGDLSDCGNEIGNMVGSKYKNMTEVEIEDFIKGIWLMLNQKEPKEYILSSGSTYTVKEFIEKAFLAAGINGYWSFISTVGKPTSPENEIFIKDTGEILMKINPKFYRPAEVDLLLGNSDKARLELNWQPEVSFETLVKRMVDNDIKSI